MYKNCNKQLWKVINELLNKKMNKYDLIDILHDKGNTIDNKNRISYKFIDILVVLREISEEVTNNMSTVEDHTTNPGTLGYVTSHLCWAWLVGSWLGNASRGLSKHR